MASELAHCVDCNKNHPPRSALIPSPFQSIIARELMPTASETAAIRDFVQESDAEISWREHAIQRLHCEVAELRRRSEQHKAIIAPIRSIPPEIMAEIFLQLTAIETKAQSHLSLVQDYYHDGEILGKEYLVRPVPHAAPLIFGQISRKWRAVALSTPGLWNSISLKCTGEKMEDNISLCDTWLQRSGALSLSFQFYRPIARSRDVSPKLVDDCHILFRTILPHAKRWRSVDLKNFPTSSYQALHDLLPNSALVLETLSVSCDWREQPVFTPWAGLCIAPKLRLLYFDSIDRANIMVGGEWPTFPWSQLTHIDVGDCSAYDCLEILGEALTAVACRFSVERASSLSHRPISHSRLQILKFELFADLSLLWSCLTCPLLSTLVIETEWTDDSFHGLPSFITRSGATIENFTLDGSSLDDTQFMASLTAMPRLRCLEVLESGGTQFTDEVWESLTERPNLPNLPPPLVPNLETLRLEGARGFSHKSLLWMLETRIRTTGSPADFLPKLKVVDLSIFRNMSESAQMQLMEFKKFGLEISIDVLRDEEDEEGSEAESESEAGGEEEDV